MDARRSLAALAVAAAMLTPAGGAAAAPADPPPTNGGCPASFSVSTVAELGFRPSAVRADTEGNDNGLVCVKPMNPQAQEQFCPEPCPVEVVYYHRDDDLTPRW